MRKIFDKINSIIKQERGTIKKEHGGKIRICLIYPDIYQVGIGNLGFQTVYRLLNKRKDVVCERAFLPSNEEIRDYDNYHLISYETKTPLYEFDILAFSLCFENDYPNIIKILELAKIPFLNSEREYHHSIVVAGGVLCFSNPEPVAEIFDIIFVGEAEGLIDNFIELYKSVKEYSYEEDFKNNLKRESIKFKGFYIPSAYKEVYKNGKTQGREILWEDAPLKIKRVYQRDFSEGFSYSQITTSESVFSEMFLLETMRGCPFSCRFCLVGHVYKPVRRASFDKIIEKIDEIKKEGHSLVGIIAPSLTAYKELTELFKISDIELSCTSLRADRFTMEILNTLANRKTLTLAPEAGSERLRQIIKKGISESDILSICQKLSETKLENLKLYFMIGLPFEKDEDIDEIVNLIKKIRNIFPRKLTASVSVFVPKPFTPFQWHRMENYENLKEKLKKLTKDTNKIKGFKLVHEVPKYSYMQGYFSRGNRKVLKNIERISKGENFSKIFEEVKDYIYEVKSFDDYLPWDFIEHEGLTKEYLWQEYNKAKKEAGG